MRELVLFVHMSLDGFLAGPNGEMDWINVDQEIFDYVGQRVNRTDTALYGRKTYEMMQAYWPTAADQPDATKHDIEHARWYAGVSKVVLSHTLKGTTIPNTTVIADHLGEQITALKQTSGSEILIFGSPTAAHALMAAGLIDGYWLFVNPVVLGQGIPVFQDVRTRETLSLTASHIFSTGVASLHYARKP